MNAHSSDSKESLLAAIVESSGDAIISTDREGKILSWNKGATNLYQFEPHEMIGKSIFVLYSPELHDQMNAVRQQVLQGVTVDRFETQRITKGGKVVDVSLSVSPIKNSQGSIIGVATISSNISSKKKMEEEVRRLNSINQAILDNSFYMVISVDKEGIIQTFNKAAESLTGYNAKEVIGKTTPIIFHDIEEVERRSRLLSKELGRSITGFDVFTAKAELGIFEENEWTYIRKDGTRFPVLLIPSAIRDEKHNITGYFGILRDMTDQKRLQIALEQNEKRFRALVDNALDSVITIDCDGVIHSFSLSSEKIFKYSPAEMIGNNIRVLLDDKEADEILGFLFKDEESFTGIRRDVTCKRRNDVAFPAEISINKMIIDERPWYIWITHDITERKKLDRMKREFISTVSHELRTPLTSIKGALGLITHGKSGSVSPQAQKLLEIALRNSDRLVRLINDILDIEKIETGNLVYNIDKHDLIPLVKNTIEINTPMAQEFNVNLSFRSEIDSVMVSVDPDRLIQVLTNLLSNAIKFSPKGETVLVEVTKMHDLVRVSVIDKGPGIPSNFHTRIFTKFAQVDSSDKRQKSGTGLGLNISKSIIEKFGGSIGYNSQEGNGSTFFFELTKCEDVSEHHKGRILICENDPAAASFLTSILQSSNISTVISYTAENAKERLSEEQFQAMLVDSSLPGQDGLSLIKELRNSSLSESMPIIVVSGMEMPKDTLLENRSFPIIDWLNKPIDANKLKFVLEQFKRHLSPQKKKILHVEDDVDLCRVVGIVLEDLADIEFAHTLSEAKQKILQKKYDLILLDLNLPDGSGLSILRDLTLNRAKIPIVIFAAADIKETIDDTGQVRAALIKSKTTNETLRREIKNIIESSNEAIQKENVEYEH